MPAVFRRSARHHFLLIVVTAAKASEITRFKVTIKALLLSSQLGPCHLLGMAGRESPRTAAAKPRTVRHARAAHRTLSSGMGTTNLPPRAVNCGCLRRMGS